MKIILTILITTIAHSTFSQCFEEKMIVPSIIFDKPQSNLKKRIGYKISLEDHTKEDTIRIELYDSSSKLVFKKEKYVGKNKWNKLHFRYLNNQLVQTRFKDDFIYDSIITNYNYNDKKLLNEVFVFNFQKRIKQDVEYDWISEEDLEEDSTWAKINVIQY